MTTPSSSDPKATAFRPQPWRDHRIEVIIGELLRAGVMLSAAIVLLGASIYLWRHGREHADYRVFQGEPFDFRTIQGVLRSVIYGRGRGLIQLGLLVLIATPIARVFFSVIGFWIERDRLYIICTLIVLAVLLFSFIGTGIGL